MPDQTMVAQSQLDREAELDALESHMHQTLHCARKAGATAAEASAHTSQGLSVTVRLGEVETLEHMQDRGISVTVYIGKRTGHASSADLRVESIAACVDRAMEIARYTQEDRCNGLAETELLATEFPDLDLWHPSTVDADAALERALACEAAGRADKRITNSEGASFNVGLGMGVYGNSNHFIGRSAGTRFGQSCILLAGKGDGMQRDYSYDSRRKLQDLESPEQTGTEAAKRTIRRLNARKLTTGEMPVVLRTQCTQHHRPDLLDRRVLIPIRQRSLAAWRDQPVEPGIEEVFPDRRPLLARRTPDDAIDQADGVQFLFQFMQHEQGTEGTRLQAQRLACLLDLPKALGDRLGGAEVEL